MEERHEREQYFFDEATLDHLAAYVASWPSPCCLCAPLLGKRLVELGVDVAILDVDERFSDVPGFQRFDVYRPGWLGREFGLVVCDPPFFTISLSQLFAAIRVVSRNDFRQPLLVSYLSRRSSAILGTFAPFDIRVTGYHPTYQTVKSIEKNDIELFGNLSADDHRRLSAPDD